MKNEYLYAIRNKDTKEIVKGVKCKGGSFYKLKAACENRCKSFNKARKDFSNTEEKYEVGKYAVIPVENIAGILIKE